MGQMKSRFLLPRRECAFDDKRPETAVSGSHGVVISLALSGAKPRASPSGSRHDSRFVPASIADSGASSR
jgi:hypothetical protein